MIAPNRTFAPLHAFVDELARCGLRHAVAAPGSRSAPLILALGGEPRIETVSVLDERSAGYAALGMAKASGRPAAVTCTSGTAAANLLPAVVEAHEARVPLIVLTADRPPELRDVGAGQSIDQLKLYGDAVEWFVEVGNHEPCRATAVHYRQLACRAFQTAAGTPRPGPVHLNFPLREPLAPRPTDAAESRASSGETSGGGSAADVWQGRPDGRPWLERRATPLVPDGALVAELAEQVASHPRGALVLGATSDDVAEPAAELAAAAGWPVLAEPTSGARCGPHDRSHVVAHYDALLADAAFADAQRADLVVRIGDTPTSKPLRAWLGSARQVVIDPHAAWHEPTRSADTVLAASPAATCRAVAAALGERDPEPGWLDAWLGADATVPAALDAVAGALEPRAYAALADVLPDGATVFVSSSMPIRHVETYFPKSARAIRFLANRGANGIDGVVSAALGARLAAGGPCYLLTGELALLHDLGGLVAMRDLEARPAIVCVNNGGGGIFDFLPLAEHADRELYERLVATPRSVDLRVVAELAGMRHAVAATLDEVRAATAEGTLVELPTDRADSVRGHREVLARVAAALGTA